MQQPQAQPQPPQLNPEQLEQQRRYSVNQAVQMLGHPDCKQFVVIALMSDGTLGAAGQIPTLTHCDPAFMALASIILSKKVPV